LLPSLKVQRTVIYLSADRDWYRGAGSHVPAVVPMSDKESPARMRGLSFERNSNAEVRLLYLMGK
jgi:hypothetical protein